VRSFNLVLDSDKVVYENQPKDSGRSRKTPKEMF